MNALRDFISAERRSFQFQLGDHLASGLSGFVAGAIVASIIWWVGIFILNSL